MENPFSDHQHKDSQKLEMEKKHSLEHQIFSLASIERWMRKVPVN